MLLLELGYETQRTPALAPAHNRTQIRTPEGLQYTNSLPSLPFQHASYVAPRTIASADLLPIFVYMYSHLLSSVYLRTPAP